MAITVLQAEMISIIVEGILYGIAFLMFCLTIWSLVHRRGHEPINRVMIACTCVLFILSTTRMASDAQFSFQGFVLSGDPALFLGDITKYTLKNSIYLIETLVGDGIIIYRCYVVWRSAWIIVVPVLGWLCLIVSGIHAIWSIAQPITTSVNIFELKQTATWVLTFYSSTLATNLLSTSLLATKLWIVNRRASRYKQTSLTPILKVVIECGALYSFTLITMIIVYARHSQSLFFIIDMIGQIIPITFYMIIIQAAMTRFSKLNGGGTAMSRNIPTGNSRSMSSTESHTLKPLEVRIQRLSDSYISSTGESSLKGVVNDTDACLDHV